MSLLFGRALALENSNLQNISEFLSTCQIQSIESCYRTQYLLIEMG